MCVEDVLQLTKSYRGDENFAVCSKLCSSLSEMSPLIRQLGYETAYSKFVCNSLTSIGKRLGWESETNQG